MAGDLKIDEQIIVLGAGQPQPRAMSASSAGAEQFGGVVTHQYGQRVIITAASPIVNSILEQQAKSAASGDGNARAATDGATASLRSGLSEVEALGLEAFELRQSPAYKSAKAQRPLQGEPWDSGAAQSPDAFHDEADEAGTSNFGEEAQAPTSSRLTGKVAVGLIIVEGPTPNLKFSQAERAKVVAEVQNGLSWLGSQSSPTGVTWVYDIKVVTLTVKPNSADTTLAQKETRWRDPAMAQLGFAAGLGGVQSYIENLRTNKNTNWSFCAFFTKYPVGHFAYASLGGPRMVMHYDNDGWGPDNIDRVFAHETGHIFNAPDEYAASGCNCGGQHGAFNVPNTNCENCAPSGGVPCIMKANTWEMCEYTPYHLGFPQAQRYSGVFQASVGTYGLWVNADWNSFVAKWQEWSNQGLRLDDMEISQPGGQLRFSGTFRQGTGGYGLWGNADWNNFVAKWQEWSNQGLRLVDLEIAMVNNQPRFYGVFRQGSGGYGLWGLADWNSFHAKWQQWSNQGLRLQDFTVTHINGQPRYSGVFNQGSGGYGLWVNAEWNNFVAKWQEWSNQGLRLADLEISKNGNQTRYSGVFNQGTGGYGLWVNTDWSSFLAKWQEWNNQGLRLIDFDITLTGIEVAASQVAEAMSNDGESSSPGFGFLSDAATAAELAGTGSAVLPDAAASKDGHDGTGMGAFGITDSTGTGSAQLPNQATTGNGHDGAGVGAVSLDGASERSAETSTAGFGNVVLKG